MTDEEHDALRDQMQREILEAPPCSESEHLGVALRLLRVLLPERTKGCLCADCLLDELAARSGKPQIEATLWECMDAHRVKGNEYEQGGNLVGAAQARAVANLLGRILRDGTWTTVVP